MTTSGASGAYISLRVSELEALNRNTYATTIANISKGSDRVVKNIETDDVGVLDSLRHHISKSGIDSAGNAHRTVIKVSVSGPWDYIFELTSNSAGCDIP